jgi:hypothetical protein
MVICYVNNVAVAMGNPSNFMEELGKRFTLKAGSVKEPDLYLGACYGQSLTDDGRTKKIM